MEKNPIVDQSGNNLTGSEYKLPTDFMRPKNLGLGEEIKASFAPSVKDALDYLKEKEYRVRAKMGEDGKPIMNDLTDLYIIPSSAPAKTDNAYLNTYATRVSPGFWGTIFHETLPTVGTVAGGTAGATAGASAGPVGVGVGGALGASAGAGAGEAANQWLGKNLFFPESQAGYAKGKMAEQAAYGALADVGGRYVVAPAVKAIAGLTKGGTTVAEALGSKLVGAGDTVDVLGQKIPLKSTIAQGATSAQRSGILEKINSPIEGVFASIDDKIPAMVDKAKKLQQTRLADAGVTYDDLVDAAQKVYKNDAEVGFIETLDPKSIMQEEIASGMYDDLFAKMQKSQTYASMKPEQLWMEVQNTPEFIKTQINNLKTQFGVGMGGLHYEDIQKLNLSQAIKKINILRSKVALGAVSKEDGAMLEKAVKDLRNLKSEMGLTADAVKANPSVGNRANYSSPDKYAIRGSEPIGVGIAKEGGAQISPMWEKLYGSDARQRSGIKTYETRAKTRAEAMQKALLKKGGK